MHNVELHVQGVSVGSRKMPLHSRCKDAPRWLCTLVHRRSEQVTRWVPGSTRLVHCALCIVHYERQ